jgi:hypothetical protein
MWIHTGGRGIYVSPFRARRLERQLQYALDRTGFNAPTRDDFRNVLTAARPVSRVAYPQSKHMLTISEAISPKGKFRVISCNRGANTEIVGLDFARHEAELEFEATYQGKFNVKYYPKKTFEQVSEIPESPGIYLLYKGVGQSKKLIYIGKAINVRRRIQQHRLCVTQHADNPKAYEMRVAIVTKEGGVKPSASDLSAVEHAAVRTFEPAFVKGNDDASSFTNQQQIRRFKVGAAGLSIKGLVPRDLIRDVQARRVALGDSRIGLNNGDLDLKHGQSWEFS